ncbi:MAG: ABC transporter ATP-binding protein [Actinomycetota bacterium]
MTACGPPPSGLDAAVRLRKGGLGLDASLRVAAGEAVALVGPNGAGKSTFLRALAGLERLEAGRVVLDGEVLEDVDAGVRVPTEERPVGVVFQDHLLFPHLDALENVAFGLRSRGRPRTEARRLAFEWLERVGLDRRAGARPAELSGGEAQRVALARALAPGPRLLLLDEPLAALDVRTRVEVRRQLRLQLASFGGVWLLVAHDPLDAMALADRLVVLEAGRVVQAGSAADLGAAPRSAYVAELVGVNLFEGRADGTRVVVDGGAVLVVAEPARGPVLAVVHPRAVALHRRRPEGTPRNVWSGQVHAVDLGGERARVRVGGPVPVVAEITAGAAADLGLVAGREVWVSIKASEVAVHPA